MLQGKLDQPLSEPASPRKNELQEINVEDLSVNVNVLRDEVIKLRKQLVAAQQERMFYFSQISPFTYLMSAKNSFTINNLFFNLEFKDRYLISYRKRKKVFECFLP